MAVFCSLGGKKDCCLLGAPSRRRPALRALPSPSLARPAAPPLRRAPPRPTSHLVFPGFGFDTCCICWKPLDDEGPWRFNVASPQSDHRNSGASKFPALVIFSIRAALGAKGFISSYQTGAWRCAYFMLSSKSATTIAPSTIVAMGLKTGSRGCMPKPAVPTIVCPLGNCNKHGEAFLVAHGT